MFCVVTCVICFFVCLGRHRGIITAQRQYGFMCQADSGMLRRYRARAHERNFLTNMVKPEFVGHTLRSLERKNDKDGMQYGRTSAKKPNAHSAQQQASMLVRIREELTPYLARYKRAERAAQTRHKHLAMLLQIAHGLTSLWIR